jgi:Family of unknown function (DUF6311)
VKPRMAEHGRDTTQFAIATRQGGDSEADLRKFGLALLVAALLGLSFAVYCFTKDFTAGEVSAFVAPRGDTEMFLVGGKYFLYDAWRFPLFVSHLVERSYPQSMVFTDCVPLFALLAKIIYKTTGYEIAWLAWWYVLVVIAQPLAFTFMLWEGGVRNTYLLIAGAAFSLLVPAWLYRIGHSALFGHFMITTAIGLYFACLRRSRSEGEWPQRLLLAWPLWLMLCSTVNVYLLAMACVFFAAALAQAVFLDVEQGRRFHVKFYLSYAGCTLAAVTALMLLLGFFVPYYGGGEFGIHSTNLLSPFIPQQTTMFSNSVQIVDATGGQSV